MMKQGKTFNLSKQTKRVMCTIVDPVARGEYKRAMIQAELAAGVKREQKGNNAPVAKLVDAPDLGSGA